MQRLDWILWPALTLGLVSMGTAQATWYVRKSGAGPGTGTLVDPYVSIQYAIEQPTTVDGDTLEVAFGTYLENVDFSGKTLRLVSQSGPDITVIDGSSVSLSEAVRSALVMMNGEGGATLVDGFTLRGGHGTSSPPFVGPYRGGVVYLEGVSPTLVDCQVRNNSSDFESGGLHFEGGAPQLTRVRVLDNGAGSEAGGVGAIQSALTLTDCIIESNGAGGDGPGIRLKGSFASLTGCSVRWNGTFDGNGGGLSVDFGSTAQLSDCELSDNEAYDHVGGGVHVESGGGLTFVGGRVARNDASGGGGLALYGNCTVQDVLILDNVAQGVSGSGAGGGVSASAQTTLRRCVLAGNHTASSQSSGGEGGATYGALSLDFCTVYGNSATGSDGGVGFGALMRNSIHWGNQPAAPAPSVTAEYSAVEGGWPGVGNTAADPLLFDAPATDFHLLLGSPAIDTADPAAPLDPDGSRADMGVYPHTPEHWVSYCTPGTSSTGCAATVAAGGTASATASSGFTLSAQSVEGQVAALFFYGSSGRQTNPWGNGSSFQCVIPPVKRTALTTSSGPAGLCTGTTSVDLNARWCPSCPKSQHNPGTGAVVQAQLWYRDTSSTSNQTTSLSDAIEFQVQP